MLRIQHFLLSCLVAAGALPAQTTNIPTVQAQGTGVVSAQPNQAQLTVSVVTQSETAQDASQQNAALTTAVINALKAKLGPNGTVQTIAYSVTQRYYNNTMAGYNATNTLQITSYDLNLVGPLIDTASQAGANSIGGVSFGLQDSSPQMQQALTAAAKQALANASAIAAGLGGKTGTVVSAQQAGSITPYVAGAGGLAGATPTPIQTGAVTVSATVTVTVQLVQ